MTRLILLACLLGLAFGADDVEVLTDKNFDEFVKSHAESAVLVEFYAPWCGHCKALEPEYQAAAEQLKKDGVKTILAKVDATAERKLASKFEIQGFPTLKYFTGGDPESPSDYGGGRKKDSIVSWIKKRELPAVTEITTKEQLDTFSKSDKLVLVGFYEKDSDEAKALKKVADKKRDNVVTGIVHASLAGVTAPKAILYRTFDEPKIEFDGPHTEKGLSDFFNEERFPLVDQIGPENYRDYMDRGLPLVWIAVQPSKEDEMKNVLASCKTAAKTQKGKLSFTYVDADKYSEHVESMGLTKFPGLLIAGTTDNTKYLYKGDITDEGLADFFEQYSAGKLEKFMKSQPIPETNDEPVKVVVGKSFEDIALDKTKNVMVEFYAPWCGHCKRLAPEYEKVAEHFKDNDDVVVAKLDATENDTPENIEGFPTLIFYAKGDNKKSVYEGKREAKALIEYLEKESGGAASTKPETDAADADQDVGEKPGDKVDL